MMEIEDALNELYNAHKSNSLTDFPSDEAIELAIKALEFQETIIRCQDCKHCVPEFEKAPTHICVRANRWPKMDDFCSKGKRKDK